jgi:butyryl-CoA dehydrogenase
MPIENTFFVVTGAASGIGRALCLSLKEKKGVSIFAIDKDATGLKHLEDLFSSTIQVRFYCEIVDLSVKEEVYRVASLILQNLENQKLILINNAGANLISGLMKDTPMEGFDWIMRTNFWSMVYLTEKLLPYMIKQNQGSIVNISSVFGLFGVKTSTPYCTTKFAVRGYSESLRTELDSTDIHLCCVHPGGIQTAICANSKVLGEKVNAQTKVRVVASFNKQARTTAEQAASLILQALANKKKRLLIGADAKWIDLIVRLFPVNHQRIFHFVTKVFFKNSLSNIEVYYR